MSLRFFSDQCVPAEITETLRRHGHQVTLNQERRFVPLRLDHANDQKRRENAHCNLAKLGP